MTHFTSDSRTTVSGSAVQYNNLGVAISTTNSSALSGYIGEMDSINHPHPYVFGGAWLSTKTTSTPGIANGDTRTNGINGVVYTNYPYLSGAPIVIPTLSGASTLASIASRSNPSAPIVDVPLFLFELREAPGLIKIAGDTLLKKAGSANLNYEFGWKPLLSDLGNLLNVQASVDRRAAHLSKMHQNGGSKSRGELGFSQISNAEKLLGFPPGGGTTYYTAHGSIRSWGCVSWVPSEDIRNGIPSVSKIRQQAFRSALGLNVSIATVWNALPWTWLIDWFSNVGDYLNAKRNTVGFTLGQCYTMTQTETQTTCRHVGGSGKVSLTLPSYSMTQKRRQLTTISMSAQLPIMTARQIGILTSLAVTRR